MTPDTDPTAHRDATDTTDHLAMLAAIIGRPDAAAVMGGMVNGNGGKYLTRRGDLKRASHAELSYRGVLLSIDYLTNGFDESAYVEAIKSVEIGGVECLAIFSEEQIGELCERIQQGWEIL
jgi:hypothetical protein